MKILTVVGARPQFIKAAVISRAIRQKNGLDEVLVHTGQHFDQNMSDVFFEELNIPKPDYNLGIVETAHGAMTGRMLIKIEEVLLKEKPDLVIVYGDTNSTVAAALAASKLHINLAHVEAGLRSYNMKMPEEINRIVTDRISNYLFCPSKISIQNLEREGITDASSGIKSVVNVGDIMYDSSLHYRKLAKPTGAVSRMLEGISNGFFLATVHRAENTDRVQRLEEIFSAFGELAETAPVILPIHPRTRKTIEKNGIKTDKVTIIDSIGYFDMITLLERCRMVLTDSGGVQKEAYFFRKPCITVRDETEWTELVESGYNKLTGADKRKIIDAVEDFSKKSIQWKSGVYGEGKAGDLIMETLLYRRA